MQDLPHRAAIAALLLVGIATALSPFASAQLASSPVADAGALSLVWQRHLLLALLGLGLVCAAIVPALRLAVVGGAILGKTGFLAIALAASAPLAPLQWADACLLALLLAAAAVFAGEAWREARWDGVLPLRSVEI